jgi:AraC family transcriptional regulator, regulatory protein of adaptative response / methylated-DNA-[protein]-cysteine methyltransferase
MNDQTPSIETDETRWAAVVARDAAFDDRFVLAVTTTGIYCRPSCPARRPRREHVLFFATCEAAERAGFRACLRCRPKDRAQRARQAELIAAACRALESDAPPSLDALASQAGLSRFHFHRAFKTATGVTPKAYATAHRAARARDELQAETKVTEAIYADGYNSNSRFYAKADAMLGMSPKNFGRRGDGAEIVYGIGQSSLGQVLVARSDRGICAVMLGDDAPALEAEIKQRFAQAKLIKSDADFAALLAKVIDLVETPAAPLDLPLDIRGTLFQQKVWAALRAIPPGTTASYAEIAQRIGAPTSTRAVAQACAANAIAIAIPCHRVVRSDGSISGYRWGPARKRALLDRERAKKN